MSTPPVSHALVLPDTAEHPFSDWLAAAQPYIQAFERVVVVRTPAGNDLNRYRNVTAVEAPRTWYKNDARYHVHSFYPMVVRVDVIRAGKPDELAAALKARAAAKDRYGETMNNPVHIYDRFILEWPTSHHPLRIVRRFHDAPGIQDDNEGLDILCAPGAEVLAAAPGRVTRQWGLDRPDELGYGQYVQVTTRFNNADHVITYAGLRSINVPLNTEVKVGDKLGEAAGESFKLVVQMPPNGLSGFRLPNIVDPTAMIYVQGLHLRPTVAGLRVRALPSVQDGQVVGQVNTWEMLEVLEPHGRILGKVGVEGEWVRVRMPDGKEGYTAAWFTEAATRAPGSDIFPGVNPVGVNLDFFHHLGRPEPDLLRGLGWVRFGYNVSANTGSEDIDAAFRRYEDLAKKYARAGYKILFATSHQTYGEGKNEFWPWPSMTDEKWATLTAGFADMMKRIARQWAGTGLVHAWQVWNEQDAPIGAEASVPMLAHNYGRLLAESIKAIRSADSQVLIITGGHTSGPGRGSQYMKDTLRAMPAGIRPDGIAFHPYGRGTRPGTRYANFGHIDEEIQAYIHLLPDKPLWITEWGVLDKNGDPPQDVAQYATEFVRYLKNKYPGRVAAMIWYAWADTMHNGYGLVDKNGRPKPSLYDTFLKA